MYMCVYGVVNSSLFLMSTRIPADKCDEVIVLSQLGASVAENLTVSGTGPANATVSVGETAVFTCTTASSGNVEWLIDCIHAKAFGEKVTIAGTRLAIADVTPSQNGVRVTCYFDSPSGVLFRSSAYLTVTCELITFTQGRKD